MRFNREQVRTQVQAAEEKAVRRTKRWTRIKILFALIIGFGGGIALQYYHPEYLNQVIEQTQVWLGECCQNP